jgi:hypothetical protein
VVAMSNTIFRDVMTFSLVEEYYHFGGTYSFHLQDRRIIQATNRHETSTDLCKPEDGGSTLLRNNSKLLPDYTALHFSKLSRLMSFLQER